MGSDLREKSTGIECVVRFFVQLLCETFFATKSTQRVHIPDVSRNVSTSSCKASVAVVTF
jgi:hypothetical protein